jgi:alanyl-tRNA synthetase
MEEQRVHGPEGPQGPGRPGLGRHRPGLDNPPTEFTGYDTGCAEGKVLAIVVRRAARRDRRRRRGHRGAGQAPRFTPRWAARWPTTGTIGKDGAVFEVTDVQKDKAGKFLHTAL